MDGVLQIDRQLTLWINHHHNAGLDALFGAVSRLGDAGVAWLIVVTLLLIFGARRDRVIALIFLAGLIITEYLAMPILRDIWYRPRPFTYMESIRTIGPEWHRPSFPSAHAYLWGQSAVLFAVAYPRFKWPLIVLTVLTLYSRPYVGNHHVIDVLAGVAFGLAVGWLDVLVAQKLGALAADDAEEADPQPQLATDGETGSG